MDGDIDKLRLDLPEEKKHSGGSATVWKMISLILTSALVAVLLLFFANKFKQLQAMSVETYLVTHSLNGVSSSFTSGGWIEPAFPYPIVVSSLIEGKVDRLNVVEGSVIREGDIIAVLYKKDLQDALHKAEAELAAAKARLNKMESGFRYEEIEKARASVAQAESKLTKLLAGFRVEEVDRAKAELSEALVNEEIKKIIWERSEALIKKGVISKEEFDKDKAEYDAARSRVESARQALKLLEAGYRKEEVEEAKAELEKARQELKLVESGFRKEEIDEARAEVEKATAEVSLARSRLSYTDIKAPVSGKVLELFVAQGDYISMKDGKASVASIYDPAQIQVRVDVRQEHIGKVHLGQKAKVTVEARKDKPYEGEVIRIEPKANLARDTIRVKVRILEPDEMLHPEMTAMVDFLTDSQKNMSDPRIMVPKAALVSEVSGDFVFVVRNGFVFKREVKVCHIEGDKAYLLSGVSEGDEVVITAVAHLKDGQKVEIIRRQ